MNAVAQLEIPLAPKPDMPDISDSIIFIQPTSKAALNLAITTAGLEHQDVWTALGIDKGQWSKICSGQNNFPIDRLHEFNNIVGNTIYLKWLNYKCGFEIKPMLSTLEQQLEQETLKRVEAEKENELMRQLLSRR